MMKLFVFFKITTFDDQKYKKQLIIKAKSSVPFDELFNKTVVDGIDLFKQEFSVYVENEENLEKIVIRPSSFHFQVKKKKVKEGKILILFKISETSNDEEIRTKSDYIFKVFEYNNNGISRTELLNNLLESYQKEHPGKFVSIKEAQILTKWIKKKKLRKRGL